MRARLLEFRKIFRPRVTAPSALSTQHCRSATVRIHSDFSDTGETPKYKRNRGGAERGERTRRRKRLREPRMNADERGFLGHVRNAPASAEEERLPTNVRRGGVIAARSANRLLTPFRPPGSHVTPYPPSRKKSRMSRGCPHYSPRNRKACCPRRDTNDTPGGTPGIHTSAFSSAIGGMNGGSGSVVERGARGERRRETAWGLMRCPAASFLGPSLQRIGS